MSRLTFKTVFSKYETSFSHKLAQKAFSTYKSVRKFLSKRYPLKEYEQYMLEDYFTQIEAECPEMPNGFDYSTNQAVIGKIELKYIDLFDYLPKENADSFKKSLRKFALSNTVPNFSPYRTREDDNRIDNLSRYIDGQAFSKLYNISFSHNDFLKKYAPQIIVSIHNLSSSFMVVKYRIIVSNDFNEELQAVYRDKYNPFSDVSLSYNIPWFKPWKFGKSEYRSSDSRYKAVYIKISTLKWEIYKEISKNVKVFFSDNGMFPPSFLTYYTNIRPSSDRSKLDFWHSIGLTHYKTDYSTKYNLCVEWGEKIGNNEGFSLSAFCGGDYKKWDFYSEISEYHCSDIYGVYMVASTIRSIAERDIATCNKKISKAIRKAKSTKLLRVRSLVEKKLYYSYRFLSEFSGESIDTDSFFRFRTPLLEHDSLTESCLSNIANDTADTKRQIDNILHLLDHSSEFHTTKSNLKLQWLMMIVTALSLFVAIFSLIDNTISIPDGIIAFFTDFFKNPLI